MQLTIRLDEGLDAALRRAAELDGRSIGDVARRVLAQAFAMDAVLTQDAEDMGLGPQAMRGACMRCGFELDVCVCRQAPPEATKPQRLAAARDVLERRGYESREVGKNGLKLEVRIPGESYVDPND